MKILKNTKTIEFRKYVATATNSTFAIIKVEHGTNKTGSPLRNVNQVNTANVIVAIAAKKFESFQIELPEMIDIIKSQGYSINS